ncbi:MAG: ice-binding family protein [Pseudomonadota bacterium]|nr:ice-binding family protein [Pseudomonadota bacterium]
MNANSISKLQSRQTAEQVTVLNPISRRCHQFLMAGLAMVAAASYSPSGSSQTVPMGTAGSYGVLAGSAITNTGGTVITGDLGISPSNASSVSGFPPGQVIGITHFADAAALQAQNDLTTAYNNAAGRACGTTISADLGGSTLVPGVYCSASSLGLTGTLTLDALGDPDAVFVFQAGSTLTTASSAAVVVINGGQSCNVFWQTGSSATLGTGTSFVGSILALDSITLTTGASTDGRVLARNAAVTMDTNDVTVCRLGVAPLITKAFNPISINPGGVSMLTITLSNPDVVDATLLSALVDNLPIGVVIAPAPNVSTTCGGSGAPIANAGGLSITLPAGRIIPFGGSCTITVDVTAALAGSYVNTIPIGALDTSNGSNAAPAVATLTVVVQGALPSLAKSFNPTTINAGGISTLTVILNNPNPAIATLTAALVDTLPAGVLIAPLPNVATSCGGAGAPVAVAGSSTVTLPAGRTIPANGSCTITVSVTAALVGNYVNTLPVAALMTSNGNNPAPAQATLIVIAGIGITEVPALSQRTALILMTLLLLIGALVIPRRLA